MNLKDWIYSYDTPTNRKELELEFHNSGPLSDSQLNELLTGGYRKYEGAGHLLLQTDLKRLKNKIPNLLTWIQDMNWPAAFKIHQLLVLFGEDIIDSAKNAFKSDPFDSIWHNNMIWVLSKIDSSKLTELKDELVSTIEKADEDGAAISALELVHDKRILKESDVNKFIDYLTKEYANDKSCTEDLEEFTTKINADNTM